MELGVLKDMSHVKKTLKFSAPFGQLPVLFANAITFNGEQPVTTKVNGITRFGITDMYLQEPKNCDGRDQEHTEEHVDWMALEPGRHGSVVVGRFVSTKADSDGETRVDFDLADHFTSDNVVVLVAIQEDLHNNKFKLVRVTKTDRAGFHVWVQQEEGASPLNTGQKTVTIGWMAMTEGDHSVNGYQLHARKVMSNLGDRLRSVELENRVGTDLPLIFGNIGSAKGGDPAFIRIIKKGLTNGKYQVLVDEDDCSNEEKEHVAEELFIVTVNPEQKFHIEFGEFTEIDETPRHVPFKRAFSKQPAYFANAISFKGSDPVVTKMQSVTRTGVNNVRLVEPQCGRYTPHDHPAKEEMDWMALNIGEFQGVDPYGANPDYSGVKIGRSTLTGSGLGDLSIKFSSSFSTDDIAVILTVQGDDSELWKTARSYNVDRTGFTLRVDIEEGATGTTSGPTTIAWMAMQLGSHLIDGYMFKAEKVRTLTEVTREEIVMANHHGNDVPLIFASIGSFDGVNPSIVRITKDAHTDFKNYKVFIDEEQCADDEQVHVPETIFVVTVNPNQGVSDYQVMSSAAFSANAFWSAGSLTPNQFPAECNPAKCDEWSCKLWCHCFEEYPQVQSLFEGSLNTEYADKISEICPDDDESTCNCEDHGLPRVDRKYIK
jgi:hypothetical protein